MYVMLHLTGQFKKINNPIKPNETISCACSVLSPICVMTVEPVNEQVAQRATIAHLSPMCQHPLISNKPASKVIKNLNSFQIREQLFF